MHYGNGDIIIIIIKVMRLTSYSAQALQDHVTIHDVKTQELKK